LFCLRYRLRVLMWAPYMWYQKVTHAPLVGLMFSDMILAVSFTLLGDELSMKM